MDKMNFVLQTPSLQHLAGVKFVTYLWTQRDIVNRIGAATTTEDWMAIEEEIKTKVSALQIPKLFKESLVNYVKPIGIQLRKWRQRHRGWTMRGTVDYRKTAELMVKDEEVDIEKQYLVACLNCLEDETRHLMQLIPAVRRQELVTRTQYTGCHQQHYIAFFAYTLVGDVDGLKNYFREWHHLGSINESALYQTLFDGNRVMCEYVFQTMNQRKKDQVLRLVRDFRRFGSPPFPFLCYLSLLSEEERDNVFAGGNCDLLRDLLSWPRQSLFTETARRGWHFLCVYGRIEVLRYIFKIIGDGYYDYWQLFLECWRLPPDDYKRAILGECSYLLLIIQSKKEELIKLVLKEAPLKALLELFKNYYGEVVRLLFDRSSICDQALWELKEKAALDASNDQLNEEKRRWSRCISRFVNRMMERRRRGITCN